ncbi:phosphocholine cytidylyltransferase family protein [Paraglaciecola aquimarina]|uniref:Phosphocholine cytidylyltransferase family protein n=1 Tax=Paraglaciecola algarum TaxID=3050085 RepID=A0ABS9D586_9ALTE|nr:phosphocholine cytidylyltransferase family protein [Paraglaciecola sp. G1-23]MCF2948117.1 phosphocholine cytidylyltransferase family protein [Paraglaciecola sp. G1-23]
MHKGLILAAGRGSRMGALTDDTPKCFTTIDNKCLVEWQLEALNTSDIDEIGIITGYKKECFKYPNHYFHNQSWASSNMVRSLTKAHTWLEKYDCIISYSDIIYPKEVVDLLTSERSDLVISYDPNWLKLWQQRFDDPLSDAETFLQINNRLIEIGATTNDINNIQGQFMGLIKTTPEGWKKIAKHISSYTEDEVNKLDMTGLLKRLISAGIEVRTVAISSWWFEVDSPSDKIVAEQFFSEISQQ